jgi:hypothetical protein
MTDIYKVLYKNGSFGSLRLALTAWYEREVELSGFPLIRQKRANEWGTGHLLFIQGVTRCASQDAQDDRYG